MKNTEIKVIIVDDHALFRLGLKGALADSGITVAGEADSGEALFNLLETMKADVVLLDIVLPDMSGIEIARRLTAKYPKLRILAISAENNAPTVKALMEIGINGFISKRAGGIDEIANAIRSIMDGEEYFGKDIAEIIYEIYVAKKNSSEKIPEFTDREKEIIDLCRKGLYSRQIAEKLFISPRTVDSHKTNIFRKLGIDSTVEMVEYALKHGIISMDS
ncbi:MAG: response regulator transcription factor [Dysgonamonadaceae bacterium]|jgi:two-component system response regulator NreC|nr:response regulator transcription factor [Dysgonamonadaceae bacterium]